MDDLRRPEDSLGFECDPLPYLEAWRKEHHQESPWYSEREGAYYDFRRPRAIRATRKDSLRRIPELMKYWRAYKSRSTIQTSLEDYFTLRDKREVTFFIKRNPSLIHILTQARTEIKKYFPESQLFLELISDPDGVDPDQLFLYISTDLSPREARPILKQFDNDWWLAALERAQRKLCISLEYQ